MKKILSGSFLLVCLSMAGFGQFTHLGPDFVFSTKVKEPGIGFYGIYRVNDQIKITPNLAYFFPHKITTDDGTQTFQWWMVNVDGNYVAVEQGIMELFGVMGLNFSNITGERDEEILGQPFKDKRSLLKLGLNIGVGARLNISDRVVPFAEARYTLGSNADFTFHEFTTSGFTVSAGVLIRITEDKDRSTNENY
jgi:hypothetical protein